MTMPVAVMTPIPEHSGVVTCDNEAEWLPDTDEEDEFEVRPIEELVAVRDGSDISKECLLLERRMDFLRDRFKASLAEVQDALADGDGGGDDGGSEGREGAGSGDDRHCVDGRLVFNIVGIVAISRRG